MTIGENPASITHGWSLDTGTASGLLGCRSNSAASGSASVTVHGAGLGLAAFTATGRGGQTGCEGTEWESESPIRCHAARIHLGSRRVSLTIGDQSGTASMVMSMDLLSISSSKALHSPNVRSAGSHMITVTGSGLHVMQFYSGSTRLGFTECQSTDWASGTSISSKISAGVSTTLRLVATVGERSATLSAAMSYDVLMISKVRASNRATAQSNWATIMGRGFGAVLLSEESQIGRTAPETSDWISDVAMKCKTTITSIARTLSAEVTVGSRREMITETASYDLAIVSSLLEANQPATGSARVAVYGLGFAIVDMSTVGQLGATGCEGTEWSSYTAIMYLTSTIIRANTNHAIVTVGEQSGSMSEAYSADMGSLSAVFRSVPVPQQRAGMSIEAVDSAWCRP